MMSDNEKINVKTLKGAFREGATPNEQDYASLIDLASVGSRAVGATDGDATTPNPGPGLHIEGGKLAIYAGQGISASTDGVALTVDNRTLETTQKGLVVKLAENSGLKADDHGLQVSAGPGLETGGNGLTVALLKGNSGLSATPNGLAVNIAPKSGLAFDETSGAIKVKVASSGVNYIEVSDDGGLAITAAGVDKIKEAMKDSVINAIPKAQENTSHGFKKDTLTKAGTVVAQIEEALNDAYNTGWNLAGALEVLTEKVRNYVSDKIIHDSVLSLSALNADGHLHFYARSGKEFAPDQLILRRVIADGGVSDGYNPTHDTIDDYEKGIYAVIGCVDGEGNPAKGPSLYAQNAVMLLIGESVRTVVGHWDLLDNATWHPEPTLDPLVRIEGYNDGYDKADQNHDSTAAKAEYTSGYNKGHDDGYDEADKNPNSTSAKAADVNPESSSAKKARETYYDYGYGEAKKRSMLLLHNPETTQFNVTYHDETGIGDAISLLDFVPDLKQYAEMGFTLVDVYDKNSFSEINDTDHEGNVYIQYDRDTYMLYYYAGPLVDHGGAWLPGDFTEKDVPCWFKLRFQYTHPDWPSSYMSVQMTVNVVAVTTG